MKKLLLFALLASSLVLSAAPKKARPTHVVNFNTKAKVEEVDAGEAKILPRKKKGEVVPGCVIRFAVPKDESKTFTVTFKALEAGKAELQLRSAKGGAAEYKSIKLNDKELLKKPLTYEWVTPGDRAQNKRCRAKFEFAEGETLVLTFELSHPAPKPEPATETEAAPAAEVK